MATKDITAMDYATYRWWTVQNVRKHFRQTGIEKFPEVIDVKRYSRFYLFVVPGDLPIPDAKTE